MSAGNGHTQEEPSPEENPAMSYLAFQIAPWRECPESHEVHRSEQPSPSKCCCSKVQRRILEKSASAISNVAGTVESKFHNFVIAEDDTSEIVAGTATLGPD